MSTKPYYIIFTKYYNAHVIYAYTVNLGKYIPLKFKNQNRFGHTTSQIDV